MADEMEEFLKDETDPAAETKDEPDAKDDIEPEADKAPDSDDKPEGDPDDQGDKDKAAGGEKDEPTGDKEADAGPEDEPKHWSLTAVMDERDKRQKLETENETLRNQLAGEKKDETKPEFMDDPEGAFEAHKADVDKAMENRVVNMAVAQSRMMHDDFNDVMPEWEKMVGENPGLYTQAVQSEHPGEFAYKAAKDHLALQEMGDPKAWREKIREEVRAEMEAEAKTKAEADEKARSEIPDSIASDRNVGDKTAPTDQDDSLESIVGT